jgi:D-erythrulose 1-phosphate 3-epimerase
LKISNDPRIYLAIDNCFASKRWTTPKVWLELIHSLGINYVEASADNECDPLYSGEAYLMDWTKQVIEHTELLSMKVANLYSGHGTYTTLGLAHTDERVKERMLNMWLEPMATIAGEIEAGFGFFTHAFADEILQDPSRYSEAKEELINRLSDFSAFCQNVGVKTPGIEQMYSPHQIPWTIKGAKELIRNIYKRSQSPFYLTIDTGHQSGQRKFLRPGINKLKEWASEYREGKVRKGLWLGPQTAYTLWEDMLSSPLSLENDYINRIYTEMDRFPYLFSENEDGDPYKWLEELGRYSPIVHLQQTNGTTSSHWPFDIEHNHKGIIQAYKVLEGLEYSYNQPQDPSMPPPCPNIYLTLEVFSGTSELNQDILKKIKDSIHYWRKAIPEDGLPLSQLSKLLPKSHP